MTRSGRTLGSPIEETTHAERRSRSPKLKKSRNNNKAGKKGVPVIDQPLSVLTRDYNIPVRDMEAWVNRSVEERMREVEKKKGYISRPMNSFMLYRSAYADRVKQFCRENNHQVVSQVTGQSWPLEPQEIRTMYERYSAVERDNHAAAHPNYKFAPNKNGKKRERDNDNDSDSDGEWGGSRGTKYSRAGKREDTRSMSSTPFEPDRMTRFAVPLYHQQQHHHPSSYQAANPYGPPPPHFGADGFPGGYYPPQAVPYGQNVDDIRYGRPGDGFPMPDNHSQLIGMPDGSGDELLGLMNGMGTRLPGDQMIDPQLGPVESGYIYSQFDGMPEQTYHVPMEPDFKSYPGLAEGSRNGGVAHPGMATLTEEWGDTTQPGSDFDSELRRWA